MLVPGALKKNEMEFLEVEDIKSITDVKPPKTKAQLERETYEEVLENDKQGLKVSDEQREKTIKCLFKVLDYQLKEISDQASTIDAHFKNADKGLKEFDEMLKKKEN